jgi:hypothetical protein
MGWKTFYSINEDIFKTLFEQGLSWGELVTLKMTIAGVDHYGAGVYSSSPTAYLQSPKIRITYGLMVNKARVRYKLYVFADPNTEGYVSIGIVGYKNDETCKYEGVYDFFGATIHIQNTGDVVAFQQYVMEFEIDGKTLKLRIDNTDLGTYELDAVPASFTVACRVDNVVSGTMVGVAVTEVVGEYYDMMEDIMAQMMSMMNIMMWIMIAVAIISVIVSLFRRRTE